MILCATQFQTYILSLLLTVTEHRPPRRAGRRRQQHHAGPRGAALEPYASALARSDSAAGGTVAVDAADSAAGE